MHTMEYEVPLLTSSSYETTIAWLVFIFTSIGTYKRKLTLQEVHPEMRYILLKTIIVRVDGSFEHRCL